MSEIDQDSYLPQQEMYLYFPQNEDIVKKILEPKIQIIRKIFHVQSRFDEEEKKFDILTQSINKEINLNDKENILYYDIIRSIISSKDDLLRYLNYNKYDVFQTINMLKTLYELLKKYKITDIKKIDSNDKIKYMLNSGYIYILGRDKKFRPIIVIDFRKYESKILKNLEKKDGGTELIYTFLYFFNFIIDKMLLPGQVEQFNVILQIDGMNSSNFINNFKDIIYLIQICFPSRLHLMYIASFKNVSESSFNLIENFLFLYNKERIITINKKKYHNIFNEISSEILKDFLEPLNISIISNNSRKNSNSNLSDFDLLNNSKSEKFKSRFVFPPIINNEIIFDSEEEKKDLMNVEDYLKFISEITNRDFYSYNENLFRKKTNILKTKLDYQEFNLENFASFCQKPVLNAVKEDIKDDLKEISPPQNLNLDHTEIYDNIDVIEDEISVCEKNIKPTRPIKNLFTDPPNTKSSTDREKKSWKKNLSIDINEFIVLPNESQDEYLNNIERAKSSDILKNLYNSPRNNEKFNNLNNDNTVIDIQGRNDACCSISSKCISF